VVRGSVRKKTVRFGRVVFCGVVLYEYQVKEGKNKMSNYKSREFYEKMFIAYIDECGLDSNMWNYCKAGLILFNIAKGHNFEWPTAFDDLPKGQMSAIVRDTVWKY
jgi:hypothetical protein